VTGRHDTSILWKTGAVNSRTLDNPSATDAIGKALRLLTLLGDRPDGAVLTDLAKRNGLPLSTAHRLMTTLVREGYARFEPSTKRYTLGLQSFRLSHRVSHERALIDVARPTMEEVSNTTREATLLSVLDGPYQLYVHYAKGPQQVSVIGEPGRRGPLHCTAMGKCLVAFAPRPLREDLVENLALTPEGPNTITDREKFRDEISLVRARGHAISDQEHETGIRAIGVPIKSSNGTALAALSTAAPAYRADVEQPLEVLPALILAAHEIAAQLPAQ
jgi:IclR family acetate operon transcriptional repressor